MSIENKVEAAKYFTEKIVNEIRDKIYIVILFGSVAKFLSNMCRFMLKCYRITT